MNQLKAIILLLLIAIFQVQAGKAIPGVGRIRPASEYPKKELVILSAVAKSPDHEDVDILALVKLICANNKKSWELKRDPTYCMFYMNRKIPSAIFQRPLFVIEGEYTCGIGVHKYAIGGKQFSLRCQCDSEKEKDVERNVPQESARKWYEFNKQVTDTLASWLGTSTKVPLAKKATTKESIIADREQKAVLRHRTTTESKAAASSGGGDLVERKSAATSIDEDILLAGKGAG